MANFTNFTRTATAAIGALILSAAFVTAAVGPATSAATRQGDSYAAAAAHSPVSVQEQQA